jgi:hypothetical protein
VEHERSLRLLSIFSRLVAFSACFVVALWLRLCIQLLIFLMKNVLCTSLE